MTYAVVAGSKHSLVSTNKTAYTGRSGRRHWTSTACETNKEKYLLELATHNRRSI